MGILNVTRFLFQDGGSYQSVESRSCADEMMHQGIQYN
jgi:dihydropteroate synthase